MYKNWREICQVQDVWLRMLVSTTEDPDILERLANAFPKLFSQEQVVLEVPFSALKAKAYETSKETDGLVYMKDVLEPFGIPSINLGYEGDCGLPNKVPPEWLDMIKKMFDMKKGYDILVADEREDPSPQFVDVLDVKCWIAEIYGLREVGYGCAIENLKLVPVQYIDFNK